jgi:hypothetical protein
LIEVGTVNETRRVVPVIVVMLLAVADAAGPPPDVAGLRISVTWFALIVPAGKLLPVTLTTVTPG